jgi:hypothetical protein
MSDNKKTERGNLTEGQIPVDPNDTIIKMFSERLGEKIEKGFVPTDPPIVNISPEELPQLTEEDNSQTTNSDNSNTNDNE